MSDAMARLWAPWRAPYITRVRRQPAACIFCRARRGRDDRASYVLERSREAFAILNSYPYNVGHLMVCPMRHVGDFAQLTPSEGAELFAMAQAMVRRLTALVRAQGFNMGINLGRAAGAGIPGHLHLHIVPRWVGDTNFMPVVGETKVLSVALDALYDRLKAAR
jgi:ATP adenylyltransferase